MLMVTRPATSENIMHEVARFWGIYLAVDPITKEMRILSQEDYDITPTPKEYVCCPHHSPTSEEVSRD